MLTQLTKHTYRESMIFMDLSINIIFNLLGLKKQLAIKVIKPLSDLVNI